MPPGVCQFASSRDRTTPASDPRALPAGLGEGPGRVVARALPAVREKRGPPREELRECDAALDVVLQVKDLDCNSPRAQSGG